MKSFKISNFLVVLVMALTIATTLSQNLPFEEAKKDDKTNQQVVMPTSLSHWNHFHSHKNHKNHRFRTGLMTCDRYPKICRLKGSSGRHCCHKKCVDTRHDRYNCGRCGKRCRYSEICCKGKCVNPMFHKKHCGSCFNKCKRRSSCSYGMCSYA